MKICTEVKLTLLLGLEQLKSNGDIGSYAVTFNELHDSEAIVNLFEGGTIRTFTNNLDYCVDRVDEKSGTIFIYHPIEDIFSQCYAALECASEKGSEF